MNTTKQATPAEKARATREAKAERSARATANAARNAPVRKAWKDLRAGLTRLAMCLRPVDVWTKRAIGPNIAEARRETERAEATERVKRLVVAWDDARRTAADMKRSEAKAKRKCSKRTSL